MPSFEHTVLLTDRLRLRPSTEADAEALFAIYSDTRVSRFLSRPAWTDMEVAHARIARDREALPSGKYLGLVMERKADGQVVGECSLFNLVVQCRRAEIGYSLGSSAQGQGLMHEALTALLTYGFADMHLNRVEADIDPRNTASAKSLERLGFQNEGHLRERWIVDGEVSDTGLYGLLARDWALLRAPTTA